MRTVSNIFLFVAFLCGITYLVGSALYGVGLVSSLNVLEDVGREMIVHSFFGGLLAFACAFATTPAPKDRGLF